MFFGAGKIIKANPEDIKMEDIMIALFAMLFGAS
jgi:hypothetical protein